MNKPQHIIKETMNGCTGFASPMDFDDLTKIKGPLKRHIEQLWDEVKKLKHDLEELKKKGS